MNHKDILKRSWKILWSYKALWIFGFILAFTTASGGGPNAANNVGNSRSNNHNPPFSEENWQGNWDDAAQEFEKLFTDVISEEVATMAITIAVLISCVIAILIILTTIFRYMSETALIQMVDQFEDTGEKLSIREGFRLGFSHTAWRVFLADLVVNLPLLLLGFLILILIFTPIFLLLTVSETAGILGMVAMVGLFFLGIFLAIIISTILSLLKQFFRRAVAIEGLGVLDGIRYGYKLVRKNLVNVGLMWLITLGINIVCTIILIPVGFLVFVISAVFSGAIGLSVGGLVSLVSQGALPIAVGIMTGLPIFLILMIVPLGFLDGLRETYMSSTWTLTYREVHALESLDLKIEADDESPKLDEPAQI